MLLQGHSVEDQIGYHTGFLRLVAEGHLEAYEALPYGGAHTDGDWERLYDTAFEIFRSSALDAVLLQFFHGAMPSPKVFVERIRAHCKDALVMASSGDGFGRFVHRLPRSMREAARVSDLSFFTGMGHIAAAAAMAGARNVLLMPNGVCQQRFLGKNVGTETTTTDIVFIGSNNGGRNPFSPLARAGRQRQRMVSCLEQRYGQQFALYGHNWEGYRSWRGPVPYIQQMEYLNQARVIVGGFPGSRADYYTSDRFYISLASGTPLVDCLVPRIDRLAETNLHWYPYRDIASMVARIDEILDGDDPAYRARAAATRAWIARGHTHYHRAAEMIRIATELRRQRRSGKTMPPPPPTFFHERVDPATELSTAIMNWVG